MTNNQISYLKYLEDVRSHRENEDVNKRQAKVSEGTLGVQREQKNISQQQADVAAQQAENAARQAAVAERNVRVNEAKLWETKIGNSTIAVPALAWLALNGGDNSPSFKSLMDQINGKKSSTLNDLYQQWISQMPTTDPNEYIRQTFKK